MLRVRVRPGAARRGVLGTHAGMLSVGVGAPPEGGKATDEARKTVAAWLGVAASKVTVLSGASSRSKRFLVAGQTGEGLRRSVAARLRSGTGKSGHGKPNNPP